MGLSSKVDTFNIESRRINFPIESNNSSGSKEK